MEKENIQFTHEQLSVIRDILGDEFDSHIRFLANPKIFPSLNIEAEISYAQELTDIIDVIQEHDGCMTYDTWVKFALSESHSSWIDYELPEGFYDMTEEERTQLVMEKYAPVEKRLSDKEKLEAIQAARGFLGDDLENELIYRDGEVSTSANHLQNTIIALELIIQELNKK